MLVPKLRFKREDGTDYPEWEKKQLEKVSNIYDGTHQTPQYVERGIPFVSVEDINSLENTTKFISEEEFNTYKIKPQTNDIFMTRITAGIIGATALVKSNNPMGYYVSLALLRPNQKKVSSSYLSQFIGSYYFRKELHKRIIHTAFPKKINKEDIGKCDTVFPCLEEQQKIAEFLSTVDEVIAQSEVEVQNLEQQKKAAMQKIFSQEVRFKREDGTDYPEWEEDTIGNCVNVTSCKRVHQSDWTDSGVPFYRAREIVALYNNEPITPLHISIEKYNALSKISGMISSGDLLVTGVGTIGVPYLVKESDKFYFKDGNIIWFQNEEKRALGSFLYYTLSTNEFQTKILQDSGKGTVHTFTIANAKETIIAIPCLEEQQKIADFLSAYDEAISYAKQELDKWKELKKGLLQQMFV